MATFNIDGLTYTEKLPHSRVERLLYLIHEKQKGGGGGGDDPKHIDVLSPTNVGNGLTVSGDSIVIDAIEDVTSSSKKPLTSDAVYRKLEQAGEIMGRI